MTNSTNPEKSLQHNAELFNRIIKFIRNSELKKAEFNVRGPFSVLLIPAKLVFDSISRRRSQDLLRLFLYNSIIAEEKKTVMDESTAFSVQSLTNLLENKSHDNLELLTYLASVLSPSYLIAGAWSIFQSGWGTVPLSSMLFEKLAYVLVGFFAATLIFNYLEYGRIRGVLKTEYKNIKDEVCKIIQDIPEERA